MRESGYEIASAFSRSILLDMCACMMPHKVCNRLLDFESTSGLLPHYIFMLGVMQCVRMVTLSLCQ